MEIFTLETPLNNKNFNNLATIDKLVGYINSIKPDSTGVFLVSDFISVANNYNINAFYFLAHAISETGWFSSQYFLERNNAFGFQAYDSDPDQAKSFSSMREGLEFVANFLNENYFSPSGFAYNRAVDEGKTPATLNGLAGIWWTSETQANTILSLMNEMLAYSNFQSDYEPIDIDNQNKLYFTVQKGGWRSEVIQEIIDADIWSGNWAQNLDKFNALNPTTPEGGWKPGDHVVVSNVENMIQVPSTPSQTDQTNDYDEVTLRFGDNLSQIFEDRYHKTAYKSEEWKKFVEYVTKNNDIADVNVVNAGDVIRLPKTL